MKLFPYKRLTLRTSVAPDEVAACLAKMVAVGRWYFRRPPEPFKGSIDGRHFKVLRVLGTFLGLQYRNSWQPVIVGDIVPAPEGTEVRVRFRLHRVAAAVTIVWFSALFWLVTMLLWGGLRHGFAPYVRDAREVAGAGVGLAFIGGMMLFGYALMSVSFWTEVKKASNLLREGLGCREVEETNRLVR